MVSSVLDVAFSNKTTQDLEGEFCDLLQNTDIWLVLFKAQGEQVGYLKNNTSFTKAKECIRYISERFNCGKLNFKFIRKLRGISKNNAIKLLSFGGYNENEIEATWNEMDKHSEIEKNNVDIVYLVLSKIKEEISEDCVTLSYRDLHKQVKHYRQVLEDGEISTGEISTHDIKLNRMEIIQIVEVYDTCKQLNETSKSRVFWNLYEDNEILCTSSEENTETEEMSKLVSVQYLVDNMDEQGEEDMKWAEDEEGTTESKLYQRSKKVTPYDVLTTICNQGNAMYMKSWMEIQNEKYMSMTKVLRMFSDCYDRIDEEIDIAERFLGTPISSNVKITLKQLSESHNMTETVNAIQMSLKAFNVDISQDNDLNKMMTAFNDLRKSKNSPYSFTEVSECLGTVFEILDALSVNCIKILKSLGNSSSLIKFLTEIVDEDIRNLIDAVEDISEQHVNETTVSALIEVKRFLQPLLTQERNKLNAKGVFKMVESQIDTMGTSMNAIETQILDCRDNMHNLRALYNNVANRGEQTKEIINNVITKGQFHFELKQEDKYCDFTVGYKSEGLEADTLHTNNTLIDLRSRALLLMSTDKRDIQRQSKVADLETFVNYIDLCLDISDLVCLLYSSGHIHYKDFDQLIYSEELQNKLEFLQKEYDPWDTFRVSQREKYYLLSCIQGSQVHTLYNFFEENGQEEKVLSLLNFIHPYMKANELKHTYKETRGKRVDVDVSLNEKLFFELIGETLHAAYIGLTEDQRQRHIIYVNCTKQITESVQSGVLLLAQLTEGSRSVIQTVLALYINTTKKFPEPNQILFCTRETSLNELQLLLGRCIGAMEFYKTKTLYCVANVEMLQSEIQFKFVEALKSLKNDMSYLLAIVCRGSTNNLFSDTFSDLVMEVTPLTDKSMCEILQQVCPNVCTYTSDIAGIGKTNLIRSRAHKCEKTLKKFPISGPIHKRVLIERLGGLNVRKTHIVHIDIGNVDNPSELDTFVFELIVLRYASVGITSECLETQCVSIEIANTINNDLQNSLQTVVLFNREHLKWNDFNNMIVSREINSPIQVVSNFLLALEKNESDLKDIQFAGKQCVSPLPNKTCINLLRKYFKPTNNMSFSLVNIFLNVLADQLKKLACSVFFRTPHILEMMGNKSVPTIKSTMVLALIDASAEFATRSIKACRSTQLSTLKIDESLEIKDPYIKLDSALIGMEHVEGMVRWEDSNHLNYVFHNQNIQTVSPLYRHKSKVPHNIKELFERQLNKPMPDYNDLTQDELQDIIQKISRTNPSTVDVVTLRQLAESYALTPDNLLKMVLIVMRLKARVPVIIMGETGCGKTSLIRYLAKICGVAFDVLNIHSGIEQQTIEKKVLKNNNGALVNPSVERWLFLDEINTSESIGMIAEIVCHHQCMGKTLAPNFVIMAACNPYKLRSKTAIYTSGLQDKIKTDEFSKLVYRVLPLPDMMVDYVWDFGSLSKNDERLYINRMVASLFPKEPEVHKLLTSLLSKSQDFVRQIEENTCSVSLRDIERCKLLITWFFHNYLHTTQQLEENEENNDKYPCFSQEHKSIILALAHCFHSRISDNKKRKQYRTELAEVFSTYLIQNYKEEDINLIIMTEQRSILERMELPTGTAQNTALQENVFIMVVCILNRIPIFVVGKPGCSKSLSMQVIKSNLRGKDSKDDLFKTWPQLYCVSFQGSESSTSDGISKVFEKAENYQNSSKEDVISVVILDEIGLAEVSRFNPLKVLHHLLEPNGQSRPDVAVVGISNWSLDASKMNRAIHLSRPDMDLEQLFETGRSISKSFERHDTKTLFSELETTRPFSSKDIEIDLERIAYSYLMYIQQLSIKNFHGLRDFYSLVKFVAKKVVDSKRDLSNTEKRRIVLNGLERNFGGLTEERKSLFECFDIKTNDNMRLTPVVTLITNNITDKMARHLMLITTGESVLGILQETVFGQRRKEIIFGSQFEEDLTDDYNYRILSRIILCMEQGIVLILQDLENIYGSLYDMLNQNYTVISKKKSCRVALGPYSNPICHVHEDFRCVVIVNKNNLEITDPPFLNRFEKQYLRFTDIITHEQMEMIRTLEMWIQTLCLIKNTFSCIDCFPIYSYDMTASLIIKFQKCSNRTVTNCDELVERCKSELMWIIRPEAIVRLTKVDSQDIRNQSDEISNAYFNLPLHNGLQGLIEYQLEHESSSTLEKECFMVIILTNSNIHTKVDYAFTEKIVQIDKVGAYKSEKQLSARMHHFWLESRAEILVFQCDVIDEERHIMLAKTIVERYRTSYLDNKNPEEMIQKHVYFVLHVDRSKGTSKILSQINFLSDWKLVTLDSLEKPTTSVPEFFHLSLQKVIQMKKESTRDNMLQYIKGQLFWTLTRIKYPSKGRNIESIKCILEKMSRSIPFLELLQQRICLWADDDHNEHFEQKWQVCVACNKESLYISSSYVYALEIHILNKIRIPLSKTIFQMEELNILDSYFIEDKCSENRCSSFERMLSNEQFFSIKKVKDEVGPETYICHSPDISLKTPFVKCIYDIIETTSAEFLDALVLLKEKCQLKNNDDLPQEFFHQLLLPHEDSIVQALPDITPYIYCGMLEDYIDDFCILASFSSCAKLPTRTRGYLIKHAIRQVSPLKFEHFSSLVCCLHAIVWAHSNVLSAELLLLETCSMVLQYDLYSLNKVLIVDITKDNVTNDADKHDQRAMSCSRSCSTEKKEYDLNEGSDNPNKQTYNDAVGGRKFVTLQTGDALKTSVENSNDAVGGRKRVQNETQSMNADVENTISLPQEENQSNITNVEDDAGKDDVTQVSNISNIAKMCKNLVENICKAMLPTSSVLQSYKGITNWQQNVNNILALASQVSQEPMSITMLRLCNDIGSVLSTCKTSKEHLLSNIGNLLSQGKSLDSIDVFDCLNSILELSQNEESLITSCQRVLANYFETCFKAESSNILDHIMPLVFQNRVPDKSCGLLKFSLMLVLDAPEGSCGMIQNDKPTDHSLIKLNSLLINMPNERQESAFSLLIVDILEFLFRNDAESANDSEDIKYSVNDETNVQLFNKCLKIVSKNNFGLQFLAAIAFIKHYIGEIANGIGEHCINDSTKQQLCSLFSNLTDNIGTSATLIFFLQVFGKDLETSHLVGRCKEYQNEWTFLSCIPWTENYLPNCFEGCPLRIYIPNTLKRFHTLLSSNNELEFSVNSNLLDEMFNNPTCPDTLLCYTIAMRQFYIPRSYMTIPDSRKYSQAKQLLQYAKSNMEPHQLLLLECLLGEEDFQFERFKHSEQTKTIDKSINTCLMTLYSLLFSFIDFNAGQELPILTQCLFKPLELSNLYIPGSQNPISAKRQKCQLLYVSCRCGYRLATNKGTKKCGICKEIIDNEISVPTYEDGFPLAESNVKKGIIECGVDRTERENTENNLSTAAYNIINIFVKGCLLGSVSLGLASTESLEHITLVDKNVAETLSSDIKQSWYSLSELLLLDHHMTGLVIQAVMRQSKDFLCEPAISLATPKDKRVWENRLSESVDAVLEDPITAVRKIISESNKLADFTSIQIEDQIYEHKSSSELNDSERRILFRFQNFPTMSHFLHQIRNQQTKYPFLWLVKNNISNLKLPRHIYNILKWQLVATSKANYMLKKFECLEMTVKQFVYHGHDIDKNEKACSRFEAIMGTWEVLKKSNFCDIDESIHWDSKMERCLIYSTDSPMYKVLNDLVHIQNKFIDNSLKLANCCEALRFLARNEYTACFPCVEASELKEKHLIEGDIDLETYIIDNSQACPLYGQGSRIVYDLNQIEKQLARYTLVGKSYICLKRGFPKMIYSDEIYKTYVSLVKNIKSTVEQKGLTSDIIKGVQEKKKRNPSMTTELLTHLGVIMVLLNKTKGDPEMSIMDYAEKMKHILTTSLPSDLLPNPSKSVKLCHVVALHELLEELHSEIIVDSLEECYRGKLMRQQEQNISAITKKHIHAAKNLLKAIRRFTHRCLSMREADLLQPLFRYLSDESFWPEGTVKHGEILGDDIPLEMNHYLPASIMVKHIHAVYQLIQTTVKNHSEKDIKLENIARSFNPKPKDNQSSRRSRAMNRR